MKTRRFFCLLLSLLFVAGCLTLPAGAAVASEPEVEVITRAIGQFETTMVKSKWGAWGDIIILLTTAHQIMAASQLIGV